jgi:hypothetical protein
MPNNRLERRRNSNVFFRRRFKPEACVSNKYTRPGGGAAAAAAEHIPLPSNEVMLFDEFVHFHTV